MSKIIKPGEEKQVANKPAEFISDIPEQDKQYITPAYIETKLSSDKKMEARNIVKVINQYGVSQRQKLFITYLLALELENRTLMNGIVGAIAAAEKEIDAPKVLIQQNSPQQVITTSTNEQPSRDGSLVSNKKILFG